MKIFDIEEVEIVKVSDEDVERFAVQQRVSYQKHNANSTANVWSS